MHVTTMLEGRVALVTGASSGNGRAVARAIAAEGARAVVIADTREEPREGGPTTHRLIQDETEADALYVCCDVTSPADLRAAVDAADVFGGVDLLVNNAGIFRSQNFLDITEDDYDLTMDINVKGTFFASQAAARSMIGAGRPGSIVNIGSVSGLAGSGSYTTYCTSKGGTRLLTQAMAAALGPAGIRVNMVAPGLIETAATTLDVPLFNSDAGSVIAGITPLAHVGTPDDIADAVVYLSSDRAAWVNGSIFVVDGGRTSTLPGGLSRSPS
jgi:NAD(P)-dependent dehydrogenase (short-subunit alcohol dehydrogenase family)